MTSVDGSVSEILESRPFRSVLVDGPLRTVVRYAETADECDPNSQAVIAKFYRDGEAARAYAIMQAVYGVVHTSPASSLLRVPRPLGFDAEHQVVLQEAISGERFDVLLSGSDALSGLNLAGQALAALHALDIPLPTGRPRRMADHIAELIRPQPWRLAEVFPVLAPAIGQILDTLLERDRSWESRREVALHRDVHPKQLFRQAERLCLIDWDLSAPGDAALDLGNLVAYLRARRSMTDAAIDALLRGYASSGAPDVLERVPTYEAFTYVRLSCKRFRLGEPGWDEECADLLERAAQCLRLG